jgi:hypothetical protein
MKVALASLEAKAKAQEPTLTPVSFESKGELAKALIDGRTFKTQCGVILTYTDSGKCSSPFRVMQDGIDDLTMLGAWDSYADLQEINAAPAEPWYLNIPPEGVKCCVSDVNATPFASSSTSIVTDYDSHLLYPFRSGGSGWKYATPVNEGK